jgi:hypothetical protein
MHKFIKIFIILTIFFLSTHSAQAQWDLTISAADSKLMASVNSIASDGDFRFIKQKQIFQPSSQNAYEALESIAQYNCSQRKYQMVLTKGYKYDQTNAVSADELMGKWIQIQPNSSEEKILTLLCSVDLAERNLLEIFHQQ